MGVLLLAIFLPLAAGALLPLLRRLPRRAQLAYVTAVLAAEAVLTVALACMDEVSVTLLRITPELTFVRDNGIAHGAEIASILHELHAQDAVSSSGDADDTETEAGE